MVTLDIDTVFAPDWRILVMAERSARISRDAASVSSRNSATLAPRRREPIAGRPWADHAFPGSRQEDPTFAPSRNNHPMISWASKAPLPPSQDRAGCPLLIPRTGTQQAGGPPDCLQS